MINADGSTNVYSDPNQPPYDGADDTLVGVLNLTNSPVQELALSSSGSQGIFALDLDGLQTFICAVTPHPLNCPNPYGPTGYEGPNTSFNKVDDYHGTVMFLGNGLSSGAPAYFSLESAVSAGSILTPRYVALGDSYSSGEGAPPFQAETVAGGQCHRSTMAYPLLIAGGPRVPAPAEHWACSGGTIADFTNTRQAVVPVFDNHVAQQTGESPQLDRLKPNGATLVTLSVGGNDIGFASIARTCLKTSVLFNILDVYKPSINRDYVPNCRLARPDKTLPTTLNERTTSLIAGLVTGNRYTDGKAYSLTDLYTQIRQASPFARVYVMGYPSLLPSLAANCDNYGKNEDGTQPAIGPIPILSTHIEKMDVEWLNSTLTLLNAEIQSAADDANTFNFIDVQNAFAGHDVCHGNAWANNLVLYTNPADPKLPVSPFSFHPNVDGQRALATAAAAAIAGDPPITVYPTSAVQKTVQVPSGIFKLGAQISWPGSVVKLSLISPSGTLYDGSTQVSGVVHQLSGNAESYSIINPEPGQWTARLTGSAQVPSAGEPVRFSSNQIPTSAMAPVALINSSTDRGVKPKAVHFDGSGSAGVGGQMTSYQWDFGDQTASATGASVDHTFLTSGNHTVSLTVTDAAGRTGTAHQDVFITDTDQAPTSSFIWTADPTTPLGVLFDAQQTSDIDGTVVDRSWSFGDSSVGSGDSTRHLYVRPGIYPVTLTVTDDGGLQSTTTNLVTVQGIVKRAIAGGQFQTLAVTASGGVSAWGYNAAGQLGNGTATYRTTPLMVTGLAGKTIVSVAGGGGPQSGAAGGHSLALDSTGHVWAWGANDYGDLGQGTTDVIAHSTPVEVTAGAQGGNFLGDTSAITAIAGGRNFNLAVSADGKVWAWGRGGSGELGNGSTATQSAPVQVSTAGGLTNAVDVAAGEMHSLARDSTGAVWAWGLNADFELGQGGTSTSASSVPLRVTIPGSGTAIDIAGAATHSLAAMSDGTAWGWGNNSRGELGQCGGGTSNSSSPIQMCTASGPINNITAVAAGEDHSAVLNSLGQVSGAGRNIYGEVGDGTTTQRTTFVPAATTSGMTSVTMIGAGQDHTIAVSGCTVYTFGSNLTTSMSPSGGGQIGNGAITNPNSTPVPVVNALCSDHTGLLRVTQTPPAVATQILVDGQIADSWGLSWLKEPPGSHTVCFTHMEGWTEPTCQTATITAGNTTTVTGTFTQRGSLRVITSPAVASQISVDGNPTDDWSMWTDVPTGSHTVCFGAVAGYNPPACQTATVTAGAQTTITGAFTTNANAVAQSGVGFLRATASVGSQITITPSVGPSAGIPYIADSWGLSWLELTPGSYTVSFSHVQGWTELAPKTVIVTTGATTSVTGTFSQRGMLHVYTSPAVAGTILVDGVLRDDWGTFTDIPAGFHTVCFGPAAGYANTPACQTVMVTAGVGTDVTGTYS